MAKRTWDQAAGGTDEIRDSFVVKESGGYVLSECGHKSPIMVSSCEFHADEDKYTRKVLGATDNG